MFPGHLHILMLLLECIFQFFFQIAQALHLPSAGSTSFSLYDACCGFHARVGARCLEGSSTAPLEAGRIPRGQLTSNPWPVVHHVTSFQLFLQHWSFVSSFQLRPSFGCDTIRKFSNNVSGLRQLAAHNFEDILLVIPAFDEHWGNTDMYFSAPS